MKRNLLILALLAHTLIQAQNTFQRAYGKDTSAYTSASCIQPTFGGGYILAGTDSLSSLTATDIFLLKTDANGDTLWARSYGTAGIDYGKYVIQCLDSGYLVCGTNYIGADYNIYLIKTNSKGDTLWTRTWGGVGDENANAVQETRDTGYIVTGFTNSVGAGNYDMFLVKINKNGTVLWAETLGTLVDEISYYVEETADKGFILSGSAHNNTSASLDAIAVKTDSVGVVQWANYYGTPFTDVAYMMKQTADSAYIMTGYLAVGSTSDALLIRADKNGDTLWTRAYGDIDDEKGYSVIETADSGFAIGGAVGSNTLGGLDAMLLKTDSLGTIEFCHGFGSISNDAASSLQMVNGEFIFAGYSTGFNGSATNIYLVKTDSAGNNTGNCNETNIILQTVQVPIVVSSFTLSVTSFTPVPVFPVTEIDSLLDVFDPCSTTSIASAREHMLFSVYPNPTDGLIQVRNAENATLLVFNLVGEKVFEKRDMRDNERTELSFLGAGSYILQIGTGGKATRSKLIIQK